MTTYTLSNGCFWCLDAIVRQLRGVEKSVVGYTGGHEHTAHYERVASGLSGHVESVQVTFDENILPSEAMLELYFLTHDPTTKNRQGADIGPQYASVMWYQDDEQKLLFRAARKAAGKHFDQPIVTELRPLERFYPAEISHQDYYQLHPENPYCSVVINPKISKARQKFNVYFKDEA